MRLLDSLRLATLSLFLVIACRSSDVPPYGTNVAGSVENGLVVTVSSKEGMSRETLTRALLREAARTTIDRGAIYLRVDQIGEQSSVELEERSRSGPDNATVDPQATSDSSEVSIGRRRSGTIRFSVSRAELPGKNVFDASALLDKIGRGELPELSF